MKISIKEMEGIEYINQTTKYLNYLEEHLDNVRKAYNHIAEILFDKRIQLGKIIGQDVEEFLFLLKEDVKNHDLSKFSDYEFVPYRVKFFPVSEETNQDDIQIDFKSAWMNHKLENHHHWETAETKIDIVHMIIDWTAMGYKFGDTAQEYYEANKDRINLSKEHEEFMYDVFELIYSEEEESNIEG